MRPAISYEAGNLQTMFEPDSRPFRASAQDVRDTINAGAIPGSHLLTVDSADHREVGRSGKAA